MSVVEDLRKYRIFKMAIFDYILTFIGAFIIHLYIWKNPIHTKDASKRTYFQYFISLFFMYITAIGVGVIVHYFFGIQSTLSGYLGINDMPNAK
jgi:hypothetical protein